jgi:PAS domain S-box-containing protein
MNESLTDKARILIVDDHIQNRILIREFLSELNVEIEEAESGKMCLEKLSSSLYSLVVLDVQMPGMDGFQVLEKMQESTTLSDIPVILVSAIFDSHEYIQKGINSGALDFMTKPINNSILQSKVKNFISLYEKQTKLDSLVKKLENVNQRVRESERKFKRITQSANDAIIMLNDAFSINFWNRAANKIFGYNKFEIISEDFFEYLISDKSKESLRKVFEGLQQSRTNLNTNSIRCLALNKLRIEFPIELSIAYYLNAVNQTNYTIIIRDISHRVKTEREALAAKELRESNKVMREFMDNMSHELRTPMNAILGISNMLLKYNADNLSKKQSEGLQIIRDSGSRLLELINDVLDLSQLESKMTKITTESFNLDKLIADLKSMALSLINTKNIRFHFSKSNNVPEFITTDAKKLYQILTNLLSNAIKFTEEGKINLYLHRYLNNLYFEVTDTGVGISKENQNIIFDRFQQIDNSSSKEHKGTGLGLNITFKLIELLGGKIEVESEIGRGTTMKFFLPVEFENESNKDNIPNDINSSEEELSVMELMKKSAIIIDFDNSTGFWLKNLLQQDEYRATVFKNSKTGLNAIKNWFPDIIIFKMEMPGIHGSSILKSIHANSLIQNVPTIGLTSIQVFPKNLQSTTAYIVKEPYMESDIIRLLKEIELRDQKIYSYKFMLFYEKGDDPPQMSSKKIVKFLNSCHFNALSIILRKNPDNIVLSGIKPDSENNKLLMGLIRYNNNYTSKIIVLAGPNIESVKTELRELADFQIMTSEEFEKRIVNLN